MNVYRLILTTVLIASKMFNDTYYTNKYVAQVGGVTLQNINELERSFMSIIGWNLHVTEEQSKLYEQKLDAMNFHEHLYSGITSPAQASPQLSPQLTPQQQPMGQDPAMQLLQALQQQQ